VSFNNQGWIHCSNFPSNTLNELEITVELVARWFKALPSSMARFIEISMGNDDATRQSKQERFLSTQASSQAVKNTGSGLQARRLAVRRPLFGGE
jgi:hypothetical protein